MIAEWLAEFEAEKNEALLATVLPRIAEELFEVLLVTRPEWMNVCSMLKLQGYTPTPTHERLFRFLSTQAYVRRVQREMTNPPGNG